MVPAVKSGVLVRQYYHNLVGNQGTLLRHQLLCEHGLLMKFLTPRDSM